MCQRSKIKKSQWNYTEAETPNNYLCKTSGRRVIELHNAYSSCSEGGDNNSFSLFAIPVQNVNLATFESFDSDSTIEDKAPGISQTLCKY